MTLAEINYMEQQMFQLANLPLTEENFPYGFDLQIRCPGGNGRSATKTNYLKITPAQLKMIESVLLGGAE